MTFGDEILDRLVPGHAWVADWPDVLERAGVGHSARLVTRRRLVMVFVALAAVLVPLAALAATNDWWFLKLGGGPTPTKAPVVVKEGEWGGHAWQLITFPSTTDGLCFSVTPKDSAGTGGALACGPFVGIARTPATKASPDMTITYLTGSGSGGLPAYIAGPVIGTASAVEIRFGNGDVLRVPTFTGPASLEGVRFYATRLPAGVQTAPRTLTLVKWVAGLDVNGEVVACLAPQTAMDGGSALADCREP
jgi:hypothetical protein